MLPCPTCPLAGQAGLGQNACSGARGNKISGSTPRLSRNPGYVFKKLPLHDWLWSYPTDPDGDKLSYSWWQYREPGTYKGEVSIRDADRTVASVQIPSDAKGGDTIHLIAEVTDAGKPALTRYARVIVTVRGN
jgi:hypothetical protein